MRRLSLAVLLTLLGCDAEPTPAADAGDATNCDPKVVVCREAAPTCPPGFVPSVEAECWGPCVDQLTCAPIACDEGGPEPQCPPMWGCGGGQCLRPR